MILKAYKSDKFIQAINRHLEQGLPSASIFRTLNTHWRPRDVSLADLLNVKHRYVFKYACCDLVPARPGPQRETATVTVSRKAWQGVIGPGRPNAARRRRSIR
jgi:hypothetical protein